MKRKVLLLCIMVMIFVLGSCGAADKEMTKWVESCELDYTFESFPYYYKPESEKLISFYNKVVSGKYDDAYYLEDDKGYKITVEKTEYFYLGEIKGSKPNGIGAIFKEIESSTQLYSIYLLGNFKDGKLSGYALTFAPSSVYTDGILTLEHEGEYSKGKRDGEGVSYYYGFNDDRSVLEKINKLQIEDVDICFGMVMRQSGVRYVGTYEKDYQSGAGSYFEMSKLLYSGEVKNDKYDGEGVLYYYDGNVKYEGEFKSGKYHGKGILYNEDGSVEYKGKFKYGDFK